MAKNIVLTGFMGVGKTSVGKMIAQSLGYKFIDTDSLIVQNENMEIAEIFKKKGEDYFRTIEHKTICDVSKFENTVIATGGGVVKNKKNVELLRKNGVIILLRCSAEVIIKRLSNINDRPLIVGKTKDEIEKMIKDREQFYIDCDFCVDVSMLTPIDVSKSIMVFYKKALEKENKA